MAVNELILMSHKYGSNPDFVLAGGGNTSYKDENYLYVKGSGTSLATIEEAGFVKMDRKLLATMWEKTYPVNEAEREAVVLEDMMNARCKGEESKRPSVETLLHDLIPQTYVLHVHPAMVNGLTCANGGEEAFKRLFPNAVWVAASKPGYILATICRNAIKQFTLEKNTAPNVIFLENHGIFFSANTIEELDTIVTGVMSTLSNEIKRTPDFSEVEYDIEKVAAFAPEIRMLYRKAIGSDEAVVKFTTNKEIKDYSNSAQLFKNIEKPFTPDHIVYYKPQPLFIPKTALYAEVKEAFDAFVAKNKYVPKIVIFEDLGMFSCGKTKKEANTAATVFIDGVKIAVYSESFGGAKHMTDEHINFILNWEVENYRQKVSLAGGSKKRLAGKISIITGSAQGFGQGIAEAMAEEGAYTIIADMNYEGAKKLAADLSAKYGEGTAFPVNVNVSDEESVKNMINLTVSEYGGLDIFVNNAGIVRAGSLEEMQKSAFELVTAVNYTAYFLCAKYASVPMKIQHKFDSDYMMDIIEINSKSGLAGSNKNFAYAGSKFGGIGLTQSFALELVEYNIKVNAVCPGNFLDGPLWSDPEKGLFVQYLNAGKVPGAKNIDDVRRFYESKVPLNRGCRTMDVARAIFYIVEQDYETGQALPVTGGQEMLK